MGRVTDLAPAGLVPAAWLVALGAHRGLVSERTLLIALAVMAVLLAAFYLAARTEMTGPVLSVWRRVLLAGLAVTLAGTVGLRLPPTGEPLVAVSLYGWMVLPGGAYLVTGRRVRARPYRPVYLGAGLLSLGGALVYAGGHAGLFGPTALVAGLGVVGLGQSAGMVTAALQNS